jgi:hypothetical protein
LPSIAIGIEIVLCREERSAQAGLFRCTGDAGMAVGFLLSGSAGQDEKLLAAALQYEDVIRG